MVVVLLSTQPLTTDLFWEPLIFGSLSCKVVWGRRRSRRGEQKTSNKNWGSDQKERAKRKITHVQLSLRAEMSVNCADCQPYWCVNAWFVYTGPCYFGRSTETVVACSVMITDCTRWLSAPATLARQRGTTQSAVRLIYGTIAPSRGVAVNRRPNFGRVTATYESDPINARRAGSDPVSLDLTTVGLF